MLGFMLHFSGVHHLNGFSMVTTELDLIRSFFLSSFCSCKLCGAFLYEAYDLLHFLSIALNELIVKWCLYNGLSLLLFSYD